MKNTITPTDLRIQYKFASGEYPMEGDEHSKGYFKGRNYFKSKYSQWLEEKTGRAEELRKTFESEFPRYFAVENQSRHMGYKRTESMFNANMSYQEFHPFGLSYSTEYGLWLEEYLTKN